jgi:hypothetical protein
MGVRGYPACREEENVTFGNIGSAVEELSIFLTVNLST